MSVTPAGASFTIAAQPVHPVDAVFARCREQAITNYDTYAAYDLSKSAFDVADSRAVLPAMLAFLALTDAPA